MAKPMIPESRRRLFFFVLSGAVGFAVYYAISNGLYYLLHVPPVWSVLLAMAISVPVGYKMQKDLTFKRGTSSRRAMPRYVMLQAINAFVIASATYVFSRFGAPQVLNFAVAGFMGVVVSFVVQDRIVFRKEG